ncbi:MAG: hypothetical protein HZY75_11835 [Nocardioidaceae bacterium]|nr:MAG: hypothetical protein HZY75_11835 [Nocardioidaceae bacterium]
MRRLTSVVGFFGGLIVVSVVLAGTGATAAAGDRVPSEAPAVTAHQTAVAEDLAELEAAADRLELPELEPGDGSGRDQHSHDGHSHDQSAYLGHDDGEQHLKYDLSDDAVLATGTTVPARFTPRKWPVRTIKYWTDVPESYRWSINAAIKSWNKTGLNMKLKLVKSRAKSNATIRVDKGLSPVSGLATVGYTRGINWIKLSPKSVSGKGAALSLSRTVMAHIVAHEIGHNLGLGHNVKVNCALMQPVLYIGECPLLEKNRPGYYVCEIVDKPAVVPMVRKYGGKKKVNPGKNCTLDALPPELISPGREESKQMARSR